MIEQTLDNNLTALGQNCTNSLRTLNREEQDGSGRHQIHPHAAPSRRYGTALPVAAPRRRCGLVHALGLAVVRGPRASRHLRRPLGAVDPLARVDRDPEDRPAMSSLALFLVGTLVTLLVMGAMALLCWGAVLDGRDEQARQLADTNDESAPSNLRVVD